MTVIPQKAVGKSAKVAWEVERDKERAAVWIL